MRFGTCAHALPPRCSIATVWIVSVPAVPHLLRALSSRTRTWTLRARRKRIRCARAVALSRLAAFARNVVRPCLRAVMPVRDSCPFALLRWMMLRRFSRRWTFGRPVRNRGFALVRPFHTILSYPDSATCTCRLPTRSRRTPPASLNASAGFSSTSQPHIHAIGIYRLVEPRSLVRFHR